MEFTLSMNQFLVVTPTPVYSQVGASNLVCLMVVAKQDICVTATASYAL